MATEAYLIAVLGAAIWSLRMVGLKLGLEEGGTSLQASLVVAFTDVVVYWGLLLALGRVDVFADVPLVGLGAFVPAGVVGTAPGRFASFGGIHRWARASTARASAPGPCSRPRSRSSSSTRPSPPRSSGGYSCSSGARRPLALPWG
jgi:hypothetical protein